MKDNKKKKNSKKVKKSGAVANAVNKIMPYILSVIAAFVLFSLSNLAGRFGGNLKNVLYGTFSNFATYFLPIFLIYHAIVWNYDVKKNICIRRVVCSIITLMCFSTMQYLIQVQDNDALNVYNVATLFTMGMDEQGGGIVGGVIGKLLLELGNIIGVIIITFILVFMILQMFNITPAYMVRSIFKSKKKTKAETKTPVKQKKTGKKVKPIKPSRVEVFDDDDTIDVEIPAFLDTTVPVSVDDEDESTGYESLDKNTMKARTEHIPTQLQPYNEATAVKQEPVAEPTPVQVVQPVVEPIPVQVVQPVVEPTPVQAVQPVNVTTEQVNTTTVSPVKEQDSTFAVTSTKYNTENREPVVEIKTITPEIKEEKKPLIDLDEINRYAQRNRTVEEPLVNNIIDPVDENEQTIVHISLEKKQDDARAQSDTLRVTASPVVNKEMEKIKEPIKEEPKKAPKPKIEYMLPPLYFLKSQPDNSNTDDVRAELQENAKIIVDTLNDFKAPSRVVDITRGPTITRYELQPEKGVRVRTIEGLVDDIALNLAAKGIRIECPIPGKNAIGIEVPNRTISFVYLRDLIEDMKFNRAESKLTCALGKSISGDNIYVDIESTPHLLVAGATGMGKSVCINSLLISLLYKAKPDEVRLILIDPKRVELSNYNGIPHLLVPVVCEPKKSLGALQWAVTEMEDRFMKIEEAGVRNIKEFNQRVEKGYNAEKMARIVIVIDELADLKMAVPDIEGHITRLTQKARAAGIHIIIGTQRPSVDVLTGLIKNNIPSRIAFRVPSQVDSRTILDEVGAEKLVSKGDMLVKLVGALAPVRVQGAYVSVDEIEDVINFWKESGPANYDEEVMQKIDNNAAKLAKNDKEVGESDEENDDGIDPEFYNALELAVESGKLSSSMLMRKLCLGFGRASRVIDQLEAHGYIGEANGPKPRDVLITKEDYQEIIMRRNDD